MSPEASNLIFLCLCESEITLFTCLTEGRGKREGSFGTYLRRCVRSLNPSRHYIQVQKTPRKLSFKFRDSTCGVIVKPINIRMLFCRYFIFLAEGSCLSYNVETKQILLHGQ